MATEDEAREAADGEEVQVEAADIGNTHLQMNLDGKLSSHEEIKDEAKIMDSTEKAPSVAEISPEHTPNGVATSLNSHMKEVKNSNEKTQENGQKDNEQVEASTDGVSTDQSNKSNGEEAVDYFGNVESTTENTSLLKHENGEPNEYYQEDVEDAAVEDKMVHKETLQTDEATIGAQQGQKLEPEGVTEDTQHASTLCPHDEVVAKAPAGIQASLEPKVNDSDALPDTSDGNTDTELAKVDKESFPEDGDIAEHTNETIKLEDQPSKQTDDVDAEVVQEEVPKSKQTDVTEDLTKTEQADESTKGDQEELNQESPEESSDPVCENTEETSHESNFSASEETTPEHDRTTRGAALDVQEVHNEALTEEIADANKVDTKKTVQQSGAAFEEATPEDIVAAIEPSSDIQHLNNVESEETKGLEDAKAEETSNESNVTVAEDAGQDKKSTEDIQPVQGLEEEPKSTETVEMDEASSQAHANVLNNLSGEDGIPACKPRVIELEEEVKDTGVTETQEITQQSHVAALEELATEDNSMAVESQSDDIQQTLEQGSVEVKDTEASETQICHERIISASEEDDVTAEGPTSDAQEVENVESVEEIKDNTADNIVEASNVATVEEEDQENNVLTSDDVSEQQTQGLEPEEIQNTEPVEAEEASDQRHPAHLNGHAPEDTIPSEMLKTESTVEVKETEATTTEALPQESNVSTSEKPASEENITASEITCDPQEVENSEQAEDAKGNKDTGIEEISEQSNDVFAREEAQVTGDLASELTVDMQSVQELKLETKKNAVLTELNEASGQMDATVLENPNHEDNSTTSESLVMESAEVSSSGVTEGQEMPQHEVARSEDHEIEENATTSEPKILEPEHAEEMGDGEATEPQTISQQSIVSSSEESVPAEDATAKEPASDIKEVQTEEPELTEEQNDVKAREISNQSSGTIVGETAQENLEIATVADETKDVKSTDAIAEEETPDEHLQELEAPVDMPPVEEPELEETKTTEPVEVHDNVMTNDLPGEEVKDTQATENAEIHNESGDLTEDVKSNVVLSDEAAPDEAAKATEETADIPKAQDPELQEIKNNEPVEVEDNIIARDLPEEIKDTEAIKTEVIPDENTSAKITEISNDVKSNVALAEDAAPEEHVTETEATIDMPRAHEPELEEIKNTEPLEVEENIATTDKSAEETKATEAMETEAINESTDANSSELTEDVKRNFALEDEAAREEHVIASETTVHIPGVQEPELEEIKNTEPVEVKENITESDLPEEEVKETEATESEVINESTGANISEPTEDAKRNVALADEAASEDHVIATEATPDIPRAQEPELESIENTEHVEVEEKISANELPAEENFTENEQQMTGIEPARPEPTSNESNVASIEEMATEDDKTILTDVTIQQLQEKEPVEFRETEGTEPQGISPSHIASTPEESAPEDNVATEPSPDTQAENLESAVVTEETKDVKSSGTIAEEETPEEHVQEFEEPVDIPPVEEPEVEETKNTEPVEVQDNVATNDLPAEEVKTTEATEIAEIQNESGDLTEDAKRYVALADEAVPRAEDPELEEIKNGEPVEVEDNIIASDVPEEEIKDTEAMETEMIPDESTEANSSELTDDVNSNVLAEEAASEEHVIETEATIDIPRAQEPELEEIKNTESVEVEGNISATDQSTEEIKVTEAMETEAINESIDANSSKLIEDVKGNFALENEAAHEEHAMAAEATVHIPRAQEPELEEIKNTEPVEVKEDISASDLPAEVVKETEATETEEISESTDANTSELTEDAETNVALADEAAPEEHVVATEVTVDIPRAQDPELEEIENAEHVEVEENISANDLPAEEVKETETMETEAINHGNITEFTEDVALADEAVPDIHVNIPPAQEPAVEEINNTEPVEAKDILSADDVMENEEIPHESTDESLTASEPLADIQQVQEQDAVEDTQCTDTIENQEPQQNIVSTADELAPTEEETAITEPTRDAHVQNVTTAPTEEEIENSEHFKNRDFSDHSIFSTAEVAAQESPLLAGEVTSNVQQVLERNSTEETREIEAVQTEDDQQHGVSNLEKPVSKNNVSESEKSVDDQEVQEDKSAMGIEEISIQDNIPTTENAAQESSEPRSDPDLLVQSEDSKDQLVKERGPSNGATLEEQTAENNAENEVDPLADTRQEHGLESGEGNKGIDATEGEEASHPSQDAGLEKLVSESNVATNEPTSDIQQANDLDDAEETTATEAINDEDISCKKTEVATLEDPSPADNGMSPKENSVELDEETLGNEISNAEPKEQKDESSDLGESPTEEGESPTEECESPNKEDAVHISGEDTVGTSNNIEPITEKPKAAIEHDAIKSGDHTNGQDDEQLHNVELAMQVCERSVDVSAIEQPDEDEQKVKLDQQKEDEVIDKQTEEIQRDEQKHDDSSTDLTTETLLEPQSSEIGTANLNEGIDMFEAEQTETVATEMLRNEQTLHIPQGSIPSIEDVKVENSKEIEETPEPENIPNITETLHTDAEDEKENIAKPSTDEQVGTIDETINEEVGNGLASPIEKDLQQTSNQAPSNEETLENNPTVLPQNVEPRVHREEEECINKVNDDMQAIQASEEEIVDEVENKQEMQNEDTDVNNDEIQTKHVDEESSELYSNESTDTKMDDTLRPYAEMVHGRIDAPPTEEEVEGNKGLSSISEYVLEKSKQNDVEQDLGIHTKVIDENLATGEQNDEEVESNSNEEMAGSYTAVTEAVKFDEAIDDKVRGADGTLTDANLETFEDNRTNLEASSVVTASGESMNEDKEHLSHPAYSAVDGNTTEQASGSEVTERGLLFPEKPLPTESEEHEEIQTTKEQDEEEIHEQETGDTEKEDEQSDLPVSNFLMNLIMGKVSTEPDGNSDSEAEKKQEETTIDNSCLVTSQQEESSVPIPKENKVDNKLISEQGKHNLEGSDITHDVKLESDEELSRNTDNLEAPVCKNNVQGEISSELVPGGPDLMTEVETRDVKLGEKATNSEEGSLKGSLDDSTSPNASQEDTLEEGRTDFRHETLPEDTSSDAVAGQTLLLTEPGPSDEETLPNDTDDLQIPLSSKRDESTESSVIEAESTIEAKLENEVEKGEEKQHTTNTGIATEEQVENLHDNSHKGTEAIFDEKTAEITEPVMGTEINLAREKEISAGSECEEEKQSSKLSNSEVHNSEKALDVQSNGSSLHINQDKQDEFAGDLVMEKNNLLDKPGESNLYEEQETEIGQESPKESGGGDQNCLAIREPVIEEENANRSVESHVQTVNTKSSEEQETFMSQVQERGLDVVSAKEAPEAEENVVEMAKPELSADKEQSPKEDKSNMAGEKTKDEEEAKSSLDEATTKIEEGAVQKVSHNQSRDLNVVLPTKAPGSEESFVDIKTPEFSTDEEQSPKKDESNMAEEKSHDEKTISDKEAQNITDEAPTKIEQREAGQKASPKKQNILSGVGSKVKHQLAKVRKAIIGKPGNTKSELPKS